MARLFVLVLALLLPLQFSWGTVLGYCQHESAPAQAHHVGHHDHEHKTAAQPAGAAVDADCGDCHASSLTGLPAVDMQAPATAQRGAPAPALPRRYTSAPPRAPDRPQWLRLA